MNEVSSTHNPRAKLDADLEKLKSDLLELGEMVDHAIMRAMESLMKQDMELATQIIADDEHINDARFAIEELCLKTIATQQPTATDLRAVVAAMNMVSDLERMGDHATGIAKSVIRGEGEPKLNIPQDFNHIADKVRQMLQDAMRAYREDDVELAHKVAEMDDVIDEQYRELFGNLLETMARKPMKSGAGIRLQFASHNLERIADRATNLVERVIFQHSGQMQELNPEPGEAAFN
jgi:phosphate transport system protein